MIDSTQAKPVHERGLVGTKKRGRKQQKRAAERKIFNRIYFLPFKRETNSTCIERNHLKRATF